MKYTEQQRQIVSLCRKYRDVKVNFDKYNPWYTVEVAEEESDTFSEWGNGIDEVQEWLETHAVLKSKSAPRKKATPKKKVAFYLDAKTNKDVAELAERHGMTKSAVIKMAVSAAFSLPTKAPCKHCIYKNCEGADNSEKECGDFRPEE